MKNKTSKLISLLLCGVMLLAALPALPGASAASPQELRQAIAAHAKNIANVEWKAENRRYTDDRLPAERQELMKSVGARVNIYYEYDRQFMPYRGPVTEYNSVSLEGYKAQLVDGYLPTNNANVYYGMNANSFVTDVLSRMIPTKVLGVKEALTAEGLTPLFSGVDLKAASSKAAAANVSYADAMQAYGNLGLGDILFAWDDDADGTNKPRLHAMVITDFNTQNRGTVTVTYPATASAMYHFTCSQCGTKSMEGPTGSVISKHMVSESYKFSRWKTHKETYPDSSCNGTWLPEGGTTWATETVSFDQLFGANGAAVPYGGTCYLPYTFDAYATGKPVAAEFKVTTDATADNITSGFKAKVESNYRIVRVDAVLSQMGMADQVFSAYPAWDAWSYEYQSAELDKALFENQTGDYTLRLNVHAGPMEDPANAVAPVTEVFKLELQLTDPSILMSLSDDEVIQGEDVVITMTGLEEGITGAQVQVGCDQKYFFFNRAASQRNSPNATFVENDDGTVTVSWFGAAAKKDQVLAKTYFTAVRTGEEPVAAKAFDFTYAQVSKKAGATQKDLEPTRVGGEKPPMQVGLNVARYKDYAPGYDLVLVMVNKSEANATYDGQAMIDLSAANLVVDGNGFSHTYAYVAPNVDMKLAAAEYTGLSFNTNTTGRRLKLDKDVDRNGRVDIADAQTVYNIAKGTLALEGNVETFLLADVDRSGKIDMKDVQAILAAIK